MIGRMVFSALFRCIYYSPYQPIQVYTKRGQIPGVDRSRKEPLITKFYQVISFIVFRFELVYPILEQLSSARFLIPEVNSPFQSSIVLMAGLT